MNKLTCILLTFLVASSVRAEPEVIITNTVITAEHATFNYNRLMAVFQENVVVIDPQIKIKSDELTILFNSTNDIKSVTAIGNVHLQSENRTATCKKCVYIAGRGEVILIGNARLIHEKDVITGNKITIWLNEDRMECEPGRLIIFPGKETGHAGIED